MKLLLRFTLFFIFESLLGIIFLFLIYQAHLTLLFLFSSVIFLSLLYITTFFLIKHYLITPIVNFTATTRLISLGNLDKRVMVNHPGEIKQLATTLNDIAQKLEESYNNYKGFEATVKNQIEETAQRYRELERFNKTMIGRELKMVELKKQVKYLSEQLGLPNQEEISTDKEIEALGVDVADNSPEQIKISLLNVLEDLVKSKAKIEHEKVEDEAILESIGDGMIATNEKGEITLINHSAEQMLGFRSDEVFGKPIEEIIIITYENGKVVPKNDRPVYVAMLSKEKIISTATNSLHYVRKDKSAFTAAITVTPVIIDNKVRGTITIFRDITKEKEIDRMKTEFISLASHQLRTPLSAIKWFSEMLLDGDAGEVSSEQKELLQNVHQSNERMLALVNSLLNISRIESGRIIVDPQPTDLVMLAKEVVKELTPKITTKKQNLIISVHQELPVINIDPKLIRQVYMNLLTNAVNYTPERGEISVFISKKDDFIISQVSDNGYGIPLAEQSRMFEKFYRATNIIKVETDGTGLGLYLVKTIIYSSKGKIWFKSEEGKGTSFWFSLPLSGMPAKKGEVSLDS